MHKPLDPALLSSPRYQLLHEGDWHRRHNEAVREEWGVWRWRGMFEYRSLLMPELRAAESIIDFGGALGPLGYDAIVYDLVEPIWEGVDWAENIPIVHPVDIVFTSHTLEHVDDYEGTLRMLVDWLKPGGLFIAHVPHVSSEWWWPENKEGHLRTFALCWEDSARHDRREVALDLRGFDMNVEINRRCGDGSMMVWARKV